MICIFRLETERLVLRDHLPRDLLAHYALLSNKKVMRYLPETYAPNIEAAAKNLQTCIDQIGAENRIQYFFLIEEKDSGEPVGEIGYTVLRITPAGKLVTAGYFIRDLYWGRGYTAEALRELMRFAFEQDGVARIICGCLKENAASERVMQKCGMVKEAEFKQYQWHEDRLKDRVEYRMLRAEWLAAQKTQAR